MKTILNLVKTGRIYMGGGGSKSLVNKISISESEDIEAQKYMFCKA